MNGISSAYRNLNTHFAGLCAFGLVARTGNFTSAAKSLGVTQSAISQRIKALEIDLGIVLFTREHRGVALTQDGRRLLVVIQPAMELIADSVSSLMQREKPHRVRLSLDFAFASFWMLPRLALMRDAVNEIDVQILTSQSPIEAAGDDCDLIIHMSRADAVRANDAILFTEEVVAVCSPEFKQQNGPVFSSADLLNQPLLSLSGPVAAPWHTWQSWFDVLAVKGEQTRQYTSFSNYDLVIQAALNSQGIALGWIGLIDNLLDEQKLVLVTDDVVRSDCGYVIRHIQRPGRTGPRQVSDWIVSQLA